MKLDEKNKKQLTVGIGILIALIVIYFLYKTFSKPKVVFEENKNTGGFNVAPAPPIKRDEYPLHVGSNGPNVKSVQSALNRINEKRPNVNGKLTPLNVDGDLGEKTRTAVLYLAGIKYWGQYGMTQTQHSQLLQLSNNL